jgi:hypothetical protein
MKGRIRESGDYLVVGIDVAKERHNAFLGTSGGRTTEAGSGLRQYQGEVLRSSSFTHR